MKEADNGGGVLTIETPLVWFQKQKESSGITDSMAETAGFRLYLGAGKFPGVGYIIPYHDRTGEPTKHYRIRVHPKSQTDLEEGMGYEEHRSGVISKYWQPYGASNMLYWPNVEGVDHAANLSNADSILLFTEGEKKALKLQTALLGLGVRGSVIGLPGVHVDKDIIKDISTIPLRDRDIFLVFDWNGTGKGDTATRRGEAALYTHLVKSGARPPVITQWPIDGGLDMGEQKIDDWLVAGGDLAEAMQYSIKQNIGAGNELQRMLFDLNTHWALVNGKYLRISGAYRGTQLPRTQFLDETNEHYVVDYTGKNPKKVYANKAWIDWEDKRRVDGICFVPPPLGSDPKQFVNNHFNVSPEWEKLPELPPWESEPPLRDDMIDTLLENFCESPQQFQWLRQHIAHCFVHPDKATSQVVILLDDGGTGKGLLSESMTRLGRHLVKEVDLGRNDDFNAELEGCVVAFYNEPSKVAGRYKDMEALFKRYVGSPRMVIRKMHTNPYDVENYLHLFITMNLRYFTHVDRHDRRCNFFRAKQTIKSVEEGGTGFGRLYAEFMESDSFLPTWHHWVQHVDLAGYSPNMLGPESEAKRNAMDFSATKEEDYFDELRERMGDCRVLALRDVLVDYTESTGHKTSGKKMGLLMRNNGFPPIGRAKVNHQMITFCGEVGLGLNSVELRDEYMKYGNVLGSNMTPKY